MKRLTLNSTWFLTAICAGLVQIAVTGSVTETAIVLVSVLIGIQTLWGFLRQGGKLLNASSIALYGLLVFGIFPAFYAAFGFSRFAHRTTAESLLVTVILIGLLQLVILALCPPRRAEREKPTPPVNIPSALLYSLIFFSVTIVFTSDSMLFLTSATGVLAIFFAAASLAVAKSMSRFFSSLALLLVSFSYYALYIFSGFGRLNLAVVGVGILVFLSVRYHGYLLKLGLLAATAPAIIWLSYQRVDFLEASRDAEISFNEGIGSVVGPFISGSIIIDRAMDGTIDPTLGTTLFAALVVGIPSAIWPGKPPGFGKEMITVTQPQLANVPGFSDAGLITGEAVWNFGVFGSLFMFLLVGLWLRFLDKSLESSLFKLRSISARKSHVFELTLVVALSSGILNIIWGGWHTYTARLFVLVVLVGIAWVLSQDFIPIGNRKAKNFNCKSLKARANDTVVTFSEDEWQATRA